MSLKSRFDLSGIRSGCLKMASAAAWLVCACIAQAQPQTPPSGNPTTPTTSVYRLESGDGIEIRFFYNPELNEQVQIRPDGRISMPLVGEINVAGMTIGDLTSRLEESYKSILKQVALTVQVRTFANRKVYVGGDVARPGMLALVGRQTVLGAILESGGLRSTAKKGEVLLVRRGQDGKPVTYRVSLRETGRAPSEAAGFELQPFDVVLASEAAITKADRFIDQYIRQMIPGLLTGGFTYLINGALLQ